MTQVVEFPTSKCKALSSNLNIIKRERGERGGGALEEKKKSTWVIC
jgi:hypothetical protein